MHPEAYDFVAKVAAAHGPFKSVVEIGGRDVNGSVRPLFTADPMCVYISIDVVDGPGVDVVAEASAWQPPEFLEAADCAVCCEVLEHAENAHELIWAARRWLGFGGLLIITCATDPRPPHSAEDGFDLRPGEFYRNVPPELMRIWLRDFSNVGISTHPRGDLYATATKC